MKLMLDLVVNHTSDEHDWFVESRASKSSSKRDWYIWRPGSIDGEGKRHPPNNWKTSLGGGSVWEWDEDTKEYYLHLYDVKQPGKGKTIRLRLVMLNRQISISRTPMSERQCTISCASGLSVAVMASG